jgi:hypothetical protein
MLLHISLHRCSFLSLSLELSFFCLVYIAAVSARIKTFLEFPFDPNTLPTLFETTPVRAWDGNDAPNHMNCDQEAMPLPPMNATVPVPSGATWIVVEIFLDVFPEDISWNLMDLDTNRMVANVQQGEYVEGEYSHWDDDVRHYVEVVPGHSYRFTIEDSFGDGIIMGGYYQILWTDQTLVLGVGAFESEQSQVFEVPEETETPSASPTITEKEEDQCSDFGAPCEPMMMNACCSNRCFLGQCQHSYVSGSL